MRSCEDCARWVYNADGSKMHRGGQPVVRPPGHRTPCSSCPKGPNPTAAAKQELNARNLRTYRLYLRQRATAGASLTDAMRRDHLFLTNMAICDQIVRECEAHRQALETVAAMGGRGDGRTESERTAAAEKARRQKLSRGGR